MITYNAQLAAALAATYPLTNARILYQNFLRGLLPTAVTASTETSDAPKDAILRPDTAECWLPTALPATLFVDLGTAQTCDAIGIAGHTLGSSGCSVRPIFSSDASAPEPYASLPGVAANFVSTPDTAANSILGDIDIRVQVAATSWTPAATNELVSKNATDATDFAYLFRIETGGQLSLLWSANGTVVLTATSTVATGLAVGAKKYVRATLDVDNGAAGRDIKFYTSDDGSIWTQLGATVTQGGVTSIFNSASPVRLGARGSAGSGPLSGKLFYAEIRNGLAGAVIARMDAVEATDGAATLVSSSGETWTINSSGVPGTRFNNDVVGTSAAGYLPADDQPLMFLFPSRAARYLQLKIVGGAIMPRIASVYLGASLIMQKQVSGPYTPISMGRDTQLSRSLSRGGQFLGQSYRRNGTKGAAMFKMLDDSWVRANFDAFSKAARRYPYFFAWNPSLFPTEVGYVWTEKDIVPRYNAIASLMDVNWEMKGVGAQ
jgi:hypothetical protein